MLDVLVEEARGDDNVIGLVVFGSRGKGAYVDERSDWDVFVVVREARGERPFVHGAPVETVELTLEQLRNLPRWNRYSLAWVEPQVDKTGEVAEAIRHVTAVDPSSAAEPLDGYINLLYRSLKRTRVPGSRSRRSSTRRNRCRGSSSSSSPCTGGSARTTSGLHGSSSITPFPLLVTVCY